MDWVTAAPIFGVILAPLFTYLVARRKSSGKVATTDAATLWAEADKMRQVYRDEIYELRKEILALRLELRSVRQEMAALLHEAETSRQEVITLRTHLKDDDGI